MGAPGSGGAAGFCLLVALSRATHQNLYWLPDSIPPTRGQGLLAIAVWALAAAGQPWLRSARFPVLEIALCAAWSAALLIAVEASGATPLRGALAGALAGMLIVAWRPLLRIIEETRDYPGNFADVA